ncbi:SCP2 sterol-binding domain-containing protein [Spiractinospora alimapuensis]|uniref:SCP2 sterol-binding domain-containing protein n=1 Tax=Spiractinospora alimapuensis TaxID=2820884 RepID=UPI001F489F6C|nr:SCP2 sterol-binding domain-containing protein [Spiractinospora alimapuensis]QVQ52110.1 SCP2 sterol-binding domain-containing protein [Spiractinospora alimapuensis]
MASIPQCRAAIDRIGERLSEIDEEKRREHIVERSVTLRLSDLDAGFDFRLTHGGLVDVRDSTSNGRAQVRITISSDDLVKLADERLGFAAAVLSGRAKVKASIPDMLRLRKLL